MGGDSDGGELTAPDAGGLVEQERVKHIGARPCTERETQGLAAPKVREVLREDECACRDPRLDACEHPARGAGWLRAESRAVLADSGRRQS
jgi:hypothetical protein